MKNKIGSVRGAVYGLMMLLGASVAVEAASIMRSPTGFNAWVSVTGFADLDGSFDISLSNVTGSVEFDSVDLNQDVHAVGGIAITDNPLFRFEETFNGDLIFSGLLQIDTTGAFVFNGVDAPQNYPSAWTLTYDGTMPSAIFPIMPPLPALPGVLDGTLSFSVKQEADGITDRVGVNYLDLSVTETLGDAPGWNGFEAYLKQLDLFSSTPNVVDGSLEISAGSEINTPLPSAIWLLGSALAGLGAVTRRMRSGKD